MPFYRMPHKTPADDPHQPGQIVNDIDWSEDFIRAQQKLAEFHNIFINRVTPGAEQDFLTPLAEAHAHIAAVIEALARRGVE